MSALGGHRPPLQVEGTHFCTSRKCRNVSLRGPKNRLTKTNRQRTLRSPFYNSGNCVTHLPSAMSKVCSITGSRVARGSTIHRRGMAKKKGGVGRHVTKNVRREFHPNLHEHRIWVPELKKFVRIRVTARGLKTINKNGAYRALKKAGVVGG